MKKHKIDTECPEFRARAARRRATWAITVHDDFNKMKASEYAYWASQPTHVVMATVSQMTTEVYAIKGIHVSRLQRTPRAF